MLIDSHCHLDFPDFAQDLDALVDRARAAGVGRMVTICTYLTRFAQVAAVAERYEGIYCSLGVHPHQAAEEFEGATVERIIAMASHPKVIGIGETGLDFFYDQSPRDVQEESFRRHIRAAKVLDLPLIVHTRDADDTTIRVLQDEGAQKGLIHCFSSGRDVAEKALELGFYISLSGIITFKKSDALRAIVADIPLDRILVETDAPYLAPVPFRGKRNEPSYVVHTAAEVARIKGIDPAEVTRQTTANFFDLFQRVPRADASEVQAA
ncbi:TatD DNase family protein [Azospirillum fermentarium]|uniref:TatD family hydrolase n=1 Tax=Azospirillum fermentarium TaxID=1233114 RepID=UPI0022268015|nr:TatD family hydrolase [Azospirillum fermentarium]MCW2246678.1 TatD DNase family protein [Azospirillum fermentarium]